MKRVIAVIGFFSILALFLLSVSFFSHKQALVIDMPPAASSCTESSIRIVWDSIFKESSGGTAVYSGGLQQGTCTSYIAYKIVGGSEVYLLNGITTFAGDITRAISAIHLNATPQYLAILRNITSSVNDTYLTALPSQSIVELYVQKRMPYIVMGAADAVFASTFKTAITSWNLTTIPNRTVFSFNVTENISTTSNYVGGAVISNYSFEAVNYIEVGAPGGCTPVWTQQNTSCQPDETFVKYFIDTMRCGSTDGMPVNVTSFCDYDKNGLIGNFSSFKQINDNLDVFVDDLPVNYSEVFNRSRRISFRSVATERVVFNYDFLNPLNVLNITIEKQPFTASQGYIIVKGIESAKTVYIDRLISNSSSVCVKDSFVNGISDLSMNCNNSMEYIIPCPGANSSFTCALNGSVISVSGLMHSAVREEAPRSSQNVSIQQCVGTWSCSEWGACSSGSRTRTCIDQNLCGTILSKPIEQETCVIQCNTLWNCTSWQPEICPANKTQTRICTDLNFCNVLAGKPDETQSCTYKAQFNKKAAVFVVSAILLFLLIIGGILWYYLRDNTESTVFAQPSLPAEYYRTT